MWSKVCEFLNPYESLKKDYVDADYVVIGGTGVNVSKIKIGFYRMLHGFLCKVSDFTYDCISWLEDRLYTHRSI